MSQKLAQMTTENGGADGLALCDWASGPLSLALCFFLSPCPTGGQQRRRTAANLAAAAGGFGLGWAGLCLLPPLVAWSDSKWGSVCGMDDG